MEMREEGLDEGLAKLDAELAERSARAPAAWAAAAVVEQSDLVDAVAAQAPRQNGELAGSGFVNRETGEAGFGSKHAWRIRDTFDAEVADRAAGAAERMIERFEPFVEAGVTPETAPSNWPEEPATNDASRGRDQNVTTVRAGTPRQVK